MAFASWWYATHGGKKPDGASKPTDKKSSETAEKKHETTSGSASTSAAAASSSRVPTSQAKTMKPADTKPKSTAKTDPAKSTQTTVPKSTTTTTSSTVKPSTEKVPAKQDPKAVQQRKKSDPVVTSGAVGKAAAASVVATSKPKDGVKEEKKTVSVAQVAAVPATGDKNDALDELIDSLGGPEDVPESPKFTGPEIADTPATSEYLEELGKRDSTIPPEYRHLLDGKGEKPAPPPPRDAKQSIGDDDLVAGLDFLSSPAPPEEKKPKLEEKKDTKPISSAPAAPAQPKAELQKKEAKPTSLSKAAPAQPSEELQKKEAKPTLSAPAVSSQPSAPALSEEALDELLGTLDGPPTAEPQSPEYTGPEVTETITQTYQEELGKRDSTIPPAYRHLLDGKDHGKPVSPPAEQPPPMSDASLVDEFSKDFESCITPAAETTPAFQPKDAAKDKQAKSDVVVPSSVSSVQSASAPSAGMESALDELMGTLEGPEFTVPESPVYTGPEVTETSTATYIEELGKRDSTIPPEYRHLLDGKGEKPVPTTPEDQPMTDSELADAFDKEFSCPEPPVAQQTPPSVTPAKPKETLKGKEPEAEVVASASSTSSALQAAPAPTKGPSGICDPLDALAGTLGIRKEDPKDKKPVTDKVKEKTGKESREKLGEDEETIPPEYRLKEIKDKDGKPLLPQPEEKPKPMSEDELLDILSGGFDATPVPSQSAPIQSSAKAAGKSVSEEIVSSSKASAVQSAAVTSPSIPDDALDLLSGSLGERQPDPDDNKPIVDVVKERAKAEHIDRLGDRDSTIPPEYRHLLDGKDQGKPAKPEEVQPKKSLSDDAAIDLLSSGFASCETGSTDKTQSSSKDKVEKCPSVQKPETSGKVPDSSKDNLKKTSTSAPVSKASEKVPEASKDKVEKSSSVQKPESSGKVPDSSKSTSQSTLEKPSAQKTSKS